MRNSYFFYSENSFLRKKKSPLHNNLEFMETHGGAEEARQSCVYFNPVTTLIFQPPISLLCEAQIFEVNFLMNIVYNISNCLITFFGLFLTS